MHNGRSGVEYEGHDSSLLTHKRAMVMPVSLGFRQLSGNLRSNHPFKQLPSGAGAVQLERIYGLL